MVVADVLVEVFYVLDLAGLVDTVSLLFESFAAVKLDDFLKLLKYP